MKLYETFELEFAGEKLTENWASVDVTAVFANGDTQVTTQGFYAGDGIYKVRFLPEKTGIYTWKVTGCVEGEGAESCEPMAAGAAAGEAGAGYSPAASEPGEDGAFSDVNADDRVGSGAETPAPAMTGAANDAGKPASAAGRFSMRGQTAPFGRPGHGVVRAVGTHFEYEDGTIYKPFGTTIYAMMHQDEELIGTTFRTLQTAPFNKVRYCLFPKSYDYNSNEPRYYAFEKDENGKWDVNRPCFAFWDHFETGIRTLQGMGIETDLILFHPYDRWGFAELETEECLVYLDYLLRRFAAFPSVWWSLANEYDLCRKRTMEDWHVFEQFIADHDPYHHLMGNHNCIAYYDHSRPLITHCCMQTAWMEKAADWMAKYKKPLIYDECCYEGDLPQNWGNLSGFEMVNRFWQANTVGAYCTHGEVFLSDDDVLWWAKGGVPKGESPARIGFLRQIMEEIPGALEPWTEEYLEPEERKWREQGEKMFGHLKESLSEAELDALNRKDMDFKGHLDERVFLVYLGRRCNAQLTLRLPKDHSYRIEVIDVWNMTRGTVMTGVSGAVNVKLPGREGMAVMAVAEDCVEADAHD